MENKCSLRLAACSLVLVLLSWSDVFAQYSKYWIQFTDRKNTPYSVYNPSQYLSARSIQRRLNQNIPVVQNDLPVNPWYVDSVKNVPNVTILNRSKWFNAITIYTPDTNALNKIKSFSFVKKTLPVRRIKRNAVEERKAQSTEGRIKYPMAAEELKKTGNQNAKQVQPAASGREPVPASVYNYGASYNQVNMLGGVCMHNAGYDGKGMVIAVLDVGFQYSDNAAAFDSLHAHNQILGGWNFVDCNSNVLVPGEVHGTWCLSLIAGNIPGQLIGTAPKAKFWLLVTEDGASENVIEEDNWVSGAEFADSVGADVLSTSLGYTEFDSVNVNGVMTANPASHTYADMNGNTARISIGTDIAASKGMLPVCAAGNSGWSPWHFIGAPADADSVLAVGAVDSLSNFAGFSSYGPSYDGRVKPNVAAQGAHPYTTDLAGGSYNLYSGTSFACPLTAGMVACLWQAHPGATNMQLFDAIQQSASHHANPDSLTGYGIPDFCAAGALLSVEDHNLASSVEVFPNPFSGEFQVTYSGGQALTLEIYNTLGEKVYVDPAAHRSSFTVHPGLPPGIYLLRLMAAGKIAAAKVMVER